MFSRRGIAISELDRLVENTGFLSRKDELLNWFGSGSGIDRFVIIDDDKSLNDLPPQLKNKLVLTSGTVGLTNELADAAIAILRNKAFVAA